MGRRPEEENIGRRLLCMAYCLSPRITRALLATNNYSDLRSCLSSDIATYSNVFDKLTYFHMSTKSFSYDSYEVMYTVHTVLFCT